MKNQNNEHEKEQVSEGENKRVESRKFLKIYMVTFFSVVITLIFLSYYAQEKLNSQIEELTNEVNLNLEENKAQANSKEELQAFLEERETLIKKQKDEIKVYEQELLVKGEELEENEDFVEFIVHYTTFLEAFFEDDYTKTIELALNLSKNEMFSLENDDSQNLVKCIAVFDLIIEKMLTDSTITKNLSNDQIESLKNIQNEG